MVDESRSAQVFGALPANRRPKTPYSATGLESTRYEALGLVPATSDRAKNFDITYLRPFRGVLRFGNMLHRRFLTVQCNGGVDKARSKSYTALPFIDFGVPVGPVCPPAQPS